MLISIITVCFNSAKTIENTIKSVIFQDYKNIEYIIIDGGSNDETIEIIEKYKKSIDIFNSEKDNGLYDALNKGISLASGEVVGILNSDDELYSNSIISEIANCFLNKKIDMLWGDVQFVNKSNEIVRIYKSNIFKPNRFKFGIMPAHPSFYCRKKLFNLNGLYRTDLLIASDFELLLRFIKKDSNYFYLNKIIVNMKTGGVSTRGISSTLTIIKEIKKSCDLNKIQTNYFFLLIKYPFKIFEFFKKG
jgi:glycosyltransferase involved in cell wall biosynthesis